MLTRSMTNVPTVADGNQIVARLHDGATDAAKDQADEEQHQEDEEQQLRDSDRGARDAAKTENRGDQSDNQKRDGPTQHD